MKIGPIVLKLRLAETRFGNNIAGAADLALALSQTLTKEVAFVVQIGEFANPNTLDSSISQKIVERFGVIVALDNAVSQMDKTGLTAYDTLYDVRSQLFKALLGWLMTDAEDPISYAGGKIVNLTRSHLWYQFEFDTTLRVGQDDGIDVGASELDDFDTLYADWVLSPSANLPVIEVLPVTSFEPDMRTKVDFTDDPNAGEFDRAFLVSFDKYKGY